MLKMKSKSLNILSNTNTVKPSCIYLITLSIRNNLKEAVHYKNYQILVAKKTKQYLPEAEMVFIWINVLSALQDLITNQLL